MQTPYFNDNNISQSHKKGAVPVDARGNASIENYRIVKTIGQGHYSK